jgi:hypothetical protein
LAILLQFNPTSKKIKQHKDFSYYNASNRFGSRTLTACAQGFAFGCIRSAGTDTNRSSAAAISDGLKVIG